MHTKMRRHQILFRSVAATMAAGALMLSASGTASAATEMFIYKDQCLAKQKALQDSGWAVITKYCYKGQFWMLEWRE